MGDILTGFMVLLILLGVSSPIIVVGVIYYLKKRLEHKQIMAAIEKGTPLSEIIPPEPRPAGPAWIKYLAVGIALIIISLGFLVSGEFNIIAAFVIGGVGAGWLVRGLLHRKYYVKNQSSAENNSTEKKNLT